MRRTILALAGLAVVGSLGGIASADTLVDFTFTIYQNGAQTPLSIYADVYSQPLVTSTNFLNLVNSGAYNNSIINFSVPGVVLQGGAFKFDTPGDLSTFDTVPNMGTIPLQYGLPNVRGTIAMNYNSNPNSATSEFFINLTDNSAALGPGPSSSGYAVFASVLNAASMTNADILGALTTYNASGAVPASIAASFYNLPLTTNIFDYPYFVNLTSVSVLGEMGDMNHDGVVNIDDALAFDYAYLHPSAALIPNDYALDWANGDFNLDGTVDGTDAAILANAIKEDSGTTLSASDILSEFPLGSAPAPVPEPGTLGVIGVGAALLLGRRRGR